MSPLRQLIFESLVIACAMMVAVLTAVVVLLVNRGILVLPCP
jgi:hypothetical protein